MTSKLFFLSHLYKVCAFEQILWASGSETEPNERIGKENSVEQQTEDKSVGKMDREKTEV